MSPMRAESMVVQTEAHVGQDPGERPTPESSPRSHTCGEAVAHRSADQGADRHGRLEDKEVDLSGAHRHQKTIDEVERVIAVHACKVEILRGERMSRMTTATAIRPWERPGRLSIRQGTLVTPARGDFSGIPPADT